VLLAKRTKPPFQWSFPGGSIEPGESAAKAAIREAREEISVEIEIVAKAGEREVRLPERRYLISVFAAKLVSGEPTTSAEASATGWFGIEEITVLDTTPGLEESAREAERVFLAAKG
jgi:8-oxo-dGTP diphosphatase